MSTDVTIGELYKVTQPDPQSATRSWSRSLTMELNVGIVGAEEQRRNHRLGGKVSVFDYTPYRGLQCAH